MDALLVTSTASVIDKFVPYDGRASRAFLTS
jgi:hypothetical protein